MLIRSLKEHWPSRTLEWLVAGWMVSWGLYVLLNPGMFLNPDSAKLFSGMAALVWAFTEYPALVWGGGALVAGVGRGIALFVNGAYARTPVIRVVTSFVSMFILTQIILGLYNSGVPNTGLITYSWLLVADLISAYRAATDAVFAERERQEIKRTRREFISRHLQSTA